MAESDSLVSAIARVARRWEDAAYPPREEAVRRSLECDNRFTEAAIHFAVNQQMSLLHPARLRRWRNRGGSSYRCRVGVVGAGNVPFADLQDFLAVVLAGHEFLGKVSSRSPYLLPAFAADVASEAALPQPEFGDSETLYRLSRALIASGSDASIREIRRRAGDRGIPPGRLLLRGNGFGLAVLDGRESDAEMSALAEDVLLHEGMGCRNVALIFAPSGLSPDPYLDIMAQFRTVFPASDRTRGALKIPEAYLQAIRFPHAAGDGFLVSKGSAEVQAPGHIRWSEYDDLAEVNTFLQAHQASVRLVVATHRLRGALPIDPEPEPLGTAQRPVLDWQAGDQDVMDFLASLTDSAQARVPTSERPDGTMGGSKPEAANHG